MAREIIKLKLDEIQVSGQVRKTFSEESLQEMADSLREVGQLQPVIVQRIGERYLLLIGERRLRAAQLVGLATIDAIVEEANLSGGDVVQRQLIENLQREGLPALETANGMKELLATGCPASKVASRLGLSAATVSRSLSLLRLPEAIQSQVRAGAIPANAAYELGKIDDAAQQAELASQIAAGQLRRDDISQVIKRKKSPPAETDAKPSSRARAELSGGRSITLAGVGLESLESIGQWLDELVGKVRKARQKGLSIGTFLRTLKDELKGVKSAP